MTLAAFLAVAAAHLLAAISPGPSFVLSVRTAASEGLRSAVGLAVGFGLCAAVWAVAALVGLSVLFELAPILFTVLKVVGGLFLVWIAVAMWRHAPEPMPTPEPGATPRGFGSAVRLGFLAMVANPKPAVFFGAVFVGLVPGDATATAKALVILNVFLVETAWYVAVARIFSLARARRGYARWKTALDRTLGAALGALGVRLAVLP